VPTIKLDDAEISYTDSGQGPAVLFVQGVGLEGRAWSPQTRELARSHRCMPRLAALRCIVLSGRLDPIATHAANAALPIGLNAQHRVWEDASHALPIQHASAVNEVLRAHFAAE
jgi:pimeloyl-ACP methyl ester carboxylesterase